MEPEQVKALQALVKRHDFLKEAAERQRRWCSERFTTDRWLDENEREWYALDRLCRSRPWATKREAPFKYPFREATDRMRQIEGPWIGDDKPLPKDTRGNAACEVLTQIQVPPNFPPEHRVLLFTPEFGNDKSFDVDTWSYLEPENEVDLWVICWQGWTNFSEMIQQVARKVASFADGVNSVWFGQGMGAIVAFEVLKLMETQKLQSPNLPVALIVSDCPAPNLFSDTYKPYSVDGWENKLSKYSAEDQEMINQDVSLMKSYEYKHNGSSSIQIPIAAVCHEGEQFASPESVEAWSRFCNCDDFRLENIGDASENKWYLDGRGYAESPESEVIALVTEMYKTYDRWHSDGQFADIGPVDNPLPETTDVVVVGAGIAGIYQAMSLAKAGKSIVCLDRHNAIGGVWEYYGNDCSRVNTSEIGYRILERSGTWVRPNEDHTPRRDILRDIYELASKFCYGMVRLQMEVLSIEKRNDGRYDVTIRSVKDGTTQTISAGAVSIHVNRRIGKRREVDWEGSNLFKGKICYGYGNETKSLTFWNKTVLIVGAGAFAFENVRTAIEHGAKHVTLLGRRDGTTCPKWVDMISFLRPMDKHLQTNKGANTVSFDCWQKLYLDAGLQTPSCWEQGMLKPHNHTISVSDLAFIAGYHGLCKLKVGEIRRFKSDGLGVELMDGSSIDCHIIIKCVGFHLNDEVPKLTGIDKMQPYNLLDFNLNYQAEPLLDWGQFGSNKQGEPTPAEKEIASLLGSEAFAKGFEIFKKLGLDDSAIAPAGNPFGSGQGGPIDFLSNYFTYLVDHPEEQAALLNNSGPANQEVVELWHSAIGQNTMMTIMKLIASLANLEN